MGTLARGPPNANKVVGDAPSTKTVVGWPLSSRRSNLAIASPCRPRGFDRLVLNSHVQPMKWDHPSTDTSIPGPNATQSSLMARTP